MNIKKTKTTAFLAASLAMPLLIIAASSQTAHAGWWEDWVSPNLERARGETIGRAFKQTYMGSLDGGQIAQLQASQGGDYTSSITDWCNNLVSQQYNYSTPYLNSTWRIENGSANCYARMLWYK